MICFWIKKKISAALNDDLPVPPAAEKHLEKCQRCREFYRDWQKIASSLKRQASDTSTPNLQRLRESIMAKCRADELASIPTTVSSAKFVRLTRYAIAATILVAVGVTVAVLTMSNKTSTPTQPTPTPISLSQIPAPNAPDNAEFIVWLACEMSGAGNNAMDWGEKLSEPTIEQTGEIAQAGQSMLSQYILPLMPFDQ